MNEASRQSLDSSHASEIGVDKNLEAGNGAAVSRQFANLPGALSEGSMNFQIVSLPLERFAPFFALDGQQLRARAARRYVADSCGVDA